MTRVLTDPQEATPALLTEVLGREAILSRGAVSAVEVESAARTNVSCVYHLAVRYEPGSEDTPPRLFLKIPRPGHYWADKEIEFYGRIAPAMRTAGPPDELPFVRCFDAAYDAKTGRSHLLFEELSATHFSAGEQLSVTRRHYEQAVDAYARLHAFWWEHPRLGRDVGELLTEETIDGFLHVAQGKLAEFVAFAGPALGEAQRRLLEGVAAAWPQRRRERLVRGQGVTLVHRDPHPLNFLYPRDPTRAGVKLVDWQSWRVDTGTDDLAYMMAAHWPAEQRAALEGELLRRYHERLLELGVRGYSWEDCCYDYRASVIRCLFFLLSAWSPRQWEGGTWWARMQRLMGAYEPPPGPAAPSGARPGQGLY